MEVENLEVVVICDFTYGRQQSNSSTSDKIAIFLWFDRKFLSSVCFIYKQNKD